MANTKIKIKFNNNEYEIDKNKLVIVIKNYLNDKNIDFDSDEETIKTLMKKHFLYDEVFLQNINKL